MLINFFNKLITISYGITVCNEAEELEKLLCHLLPLIDENDEVIVLQDITNRNKKVDEILKKFKDKITVIESELNGDFATFKNNLISKATKKYLFQIDADEVPKPELIKNLKYYLAKKYRYDVFLIPRINTVNGITEKHIEKWKWHINENGFINFPDYQPRILKNNGKIKWKNKVHEVFYGYKKHKKLPSNNYDFCLLHEKNIQKQESQNDFYDTIE